MSKVKHILWNSFTTLRMLSIESATPVTAVFMDIDLMVVFLIIVISPFNDIYKANGSKSLFNFWVSIFAIEGTWIGSSQCLHMS